MCGICGFAHPEGSARRVSRDALVRARDQLRHRGPDDQGLYLGRRAGLGHRRLSIVDVEGGHQPFASDDGHLHLVYNGEVYNHRELRGGLEARGHRYRTRCDTETVLRMYQEQGAASVERLRGMFAFAVWDEREGELFLARDRLGIKPLYYVHADDGSLYFASEIKALLALGAVEPALNHGALPDYLANHAPSGQETLFRGVRRLPPGHLLTWRDGDVRIRRYWAPRFVADGEPRDDEEWVEGFRERLTESIRLRLMADVPLGVFLSGGLDSASICAVMSRLVDDPIQSFSVAFAERQANELEYARSVARAFGTDHHEVVVSPEQFFRRLPRLVWHEDEPIAHPSSVPLHAVAELASERVKVVLTGEGSDELLGGYSRYWKSLANLRAGRAWERVAPPALRRGVREAVGALPRGSELRQKAERTFLCLPADVASLYLDAFAVFSRERQEALLAPEARARTEGADPYARQRELLADGGADSDLNRLLYMDVRTYLHELLMKQDQMSMAASLESRVPFLDHLLVEYAGRMPERWKVRRLTTKRVLREAMEGVLPEAILERPKMGFPVPFGQWARGPYRPFVEEVVLGDRARARELFDPDYVRRLVEEHAKGEVDHAERLWSLVNLELWQRIFLDGESPAAVQPERMARAAG